MTRLIRNFARDESGATSVEYGMIILIMALGIIGALSAFPEKLNAIWSSIAGYFK